MDEETDPEQAEKQRKLWKLFGRETQAGKELFSLYNKAEKPKIEYPKVKQKSEQQKLTEKEKLTNNKKCPQKTAIEYPQEKKPTSKYHPIDFIPKKKAENVIRVQIEEYKKRREKDVPANRGVDRSALVANLQDKFNLQSGGLPKQLPGIKDEKIDFDEEKIKNNAKVRVEKKYKNYTNPVGKKEEKKKRNEGDELDTLFEDIVGEIDERQSYLDSINHLDEPELKAKIKKEMIQRIAELQRITELKKK